MPTSSKENKRNKIKRKVEAENKKMEKSLLEYAHG
jgi:hypothetical protein